MKGTVRRDMTGSGWRVNGNGDSAEREPRVAVALFSWENARQGASGSSGNTPSCRSQNSIPAGSGLNSPNEKSVQNPLLEIVGTALIAAMIGSLVWFLIGVFYRGEHTVRLCWILGLFSIAAVLVSRISIESGRDRSYIFGVPLAAATVLVSLMLVQGSVLFPVLMVGFVLLVMWLADRLTWDATVIDGSRDVSAVGLLELVRRRTRRSPSVRADATNSQSGLPVTADGTEGELPADRSGETASDARPGNFWLALAGLARGRNTPGLWSLHFIFAALVVFGVGQLFIRPDTETGYLWVSFLFAVFVASSLSLMTLTSLFGLQRYLGRRKLEFPEGLVRRWLTVGITVAGLAAVTTLLVPRPNVPGMLADSATWLTSRPRDPSRFAFGRDGTRPGENPRSAVAQNGPSGGENGKTNGSGSPTGQGGSQGRGGSGQGGSGGNGPPQSGGSSGGQSSGSSTGGSPTGSSSTGSPSDGRSPPGQQGGQNAPSGEQPAAGDSKGGGSKSSSDSSSENAQQPGDSGEQSPGNPPSGADRREPGATSKGEPNDRQNQEASGNGGASSPPASSRGASSPPPPGARPSGGGGEWFSRAAGQFTRWLTIAVGVLALALAAWMFRAELSRWLAEFRAWMSGGKKAPEGGLDRGMERPALLRRKPFSSLSNPFVDGRAGRLDPGELVRETFAAMEILAAESGAARAPEATPHEFAQALSTAIPELSPAARTLAEIYGKTAYGSTLPEAGETKRLGQVWQAMEEHAARPAAGRLAPTA